MEINNFRILLDISEVDVRPSNYIWLNVTPDETKTIYDLKLAISKKFHSGDYNFQLFLNKGLLPENETISILRENDIVKIQSAPSLNESSDVQIYSTDSSSSKKKRKLLSIAECTSHGSIIPSKKRNGNTNHSVDNGCEISSFDGQSSFNHGLPSIDDESYQDSTRKKRKKKPRDSVGTEGTLDEHCSTLVDHGIDLSESHSLNSPHREVQDNAEAIASRHRSSFCGSSSVYVDNLSAKKVKEKRRKSHLDQTEDSLGDQSRIAAHNQAAFCGLASIYVDNPSVKKAKQKRRKSQLDQSEEILADQSRDLSSSYYINPCEVVSESSKMPNHSNVGSYKSKAANTQKMDLQEAKDDLIASITTLSSDSQSRLKVGDSGRSSIEILHIVEPKVKKDKRKRKRKRSKKIPKTANSSGSSVDMQPSSKSAPVFSDNYENLRKHVRFPASPSPADEELAIAKETTIATTDLSGTTLHPESTSSSDDDMDGIKEILAVQTSTLAGIPTTLSLTNRGSDKTELLEKERNEICLQPPIKDADISSRNEQLPILSSVPPEGSCISFKILQLDEHYCPAVSETLQGKVVNISDDGKLVVIELKDPIVKAVRTGKFENNQEGEDQEPEIEKELQLSWSDIIEPRLLPTIF